MCQVREIHCSKAKCLRVHNIVSRRLFSALLIGTDIPVTCSFIPLQVPPILEANTPLSCSQDTEELPRDFNLTARKVVTCTPQLSLHALHTAMLLNNECNTLQTVFASAC
jgi:hypothetical protein